jgi:hypothetical protein
MKVRPLFAMALAGLLVLAFAGSVTAQPRQEGLVNVNVSDVYIQVPVAVAANICELNVNVLARQLRAGGAECEAVADPEGTIAWPNRNGGGGSQEGLVNVNVNDVWVQLPIGIAANVCEVNANVLAGQARLGEATCEAITTPIAG